MNGFQKFYWLFKRLKRSNRRILQEGDTKTALNSLKAKYRKFFYKKEIKRLKIEITNLLIHKNKTNESSNEKSIECRKKRNEEFKKYLEQFKEKEEYGEYVDLTKEYKKYKEILNVKSYKLFLEKIFFINFQINEKTITVVIAVIRYLKRYYIRLNPGIKNIVLEKESVFLEEGMYKTIMQEYLKFLKFFSRQFVKTMEINFNKKKPITLNIYCEFCSESFFNSKELNNHIKTNKHKSHFLNFKGINIFNKSNINNFIFKQSLKKFKEFLFKFKK